LVKFTDFGGQGAVIHFAHANAYAPKTYTYFLSKLTEKFRVISMDQRPLWPNEDLNSFSDWKILGDDIVQFVNGQNINQAILIGHSMGGIASLIAASINPQIITKVILIDPVILPEQLIHQMSEQQMEDRLRQNPMVQIALKRRNIWPTKQAAKEYFNSKSFFKKFSSQAKSDFLTHGIMELEDGFHLSYSNKWEARIYGTVVNPWPYLRSNSVPMHIIKAEQSDVIDSETWNIINEQTSNCTCYELPDSGHLIPQEKPEFLSQVIFDFLED